MFDAGVDEQLIMYRTGHSSSEGVRSYKRVTENLKEMTSDVLNPFAVTANLAQNRVDIFDHIAAVLPQKNALAQSFPMVCLVTTQHLPNMD